MAYTKDKKFIGKMFDEISPTYDRLNHLLSGMQDKKWRRKAVSYLAKQNPEYPHILDLASGSGDLAAEFLRLNPDKLYSVDLSLEMLKINKSKINSDINLPIKAEAEHLPFLNNFFNLTGIGFGVRNFDNLKNCIREIYRVIKPRGRFLTIEMFKANKNGIMQKSFKIYFKNVPSKVGKFLSKNDYAYDYLFDSVDNFLTVSEYCAILEETGFKTEYVKNNFLGIVNTVIAVK